MPNRCLLPCLIALSSFTDSLVLHRPIAPPCSRCPPVLASEAGEEPNAEAGKDVDTTDAVNSVLFASLRARRKKLDADVEQRWRKADAASFVPLALNDWIRRLDCAWPLAAMGTSRGGLLVADLAAGTCVAQAPAAHPPSVDTPAVAEATSLLHGDYDGGGLLAIALQSDRVASAGRDGGAKVWRVEGDELLPVGTLSTDGGLVSSLLWPSAAGPIWAGGLDGVARAWLDPSAGGAADVCVTCAAPVLAMAGSADLGLLACGTSDGGVEMLRWGDGKRRGEWRPFAAPAEKAQRCRSVAFHQDPLTGRWWCYAGGSAGGLQRRMLAEAGNAEGDVFERAAQELAPSHGGAVVSIVAGPNRLLVTGAHDGTLRVWDVAGAESPPGAPKVLYGLGGYKVWLGSVCTDGRRIVSDGSDNRVTVHDFSGEPPVKRK